MTLCKLTGGEMTMKMDTFWGSTLTLFLNDKSIMHFINMISLLLVVIFIFNLNNHFILNLILSIITSSTVSNQLLHISSSIISGFIYRKRFKNSFKTGEIVLISQLTTKLIVFCHENRFKGWAPFFLLINLFPIIFKFKSSFNFLSVALTWIVFSTNFSLNREMIFNLFTEIFKDKRLLFYWPSLLFLIILLPISYPFSNQNSLRKFYHFACVVLFLPAAFWSLNVLKVAFAVALTLFLYIEIIRNDLKEEFKNSVYFLKFNDFMENCRNELDCGEMILSHFYLLLGCSLPFFINPNNSLNISSFSGLISLGIGDSLASIGGKRFGKNTWHSKTRKTLEGSFFGFIGMFITWTFLNEFLLSKISIKKLVFISFSSTIWEALINLNDNLTLPLFTLFIFNKITANS